MDKNQALTKGQSWLKRCGSVAVIVAFLLSNLGLVFQNAYANNLQSSPVSSNLPANSTAPSQIGDDTALDFNSGNPGNCSSISETTDGELSLLPAVGAEFSGTTLPAGWVDAPWTVYQPGGSSQVGGGVVSVDESLLATSIYYSSGHILDFVATFQPDVNQHAGWVVDLATSANWAFFSLGAPGGTIIKARTMVDGIPTETDTAFTAGSPHHFRIVWTSIQVIYFIDDMATPVATHDATFNAQLRPGFSDLSPDGPVDHTKKLVIDWLHMSPYTSPCTFTSRVLDAGTSVNWQALSWAASLPAGTNLAFSYQVGNTSSPDNTWSSFIGVLTSGATIAGQGRYVRYRVVLSTTDPTVTPEVQEVLFTITTDADTSAPTILSRSPDTGATNVSRNPDVTVTFNELLNPTTVNDSTVFLHISGTGTGIPANVSLSAGNIITLHPTVALALGTDYTVTIKSSVADLANNLLGADDVWIFTTTLSMMDTTFDDFQSGTGCYLADTSGGEIILPPHIGAEFSGTVLPVDWAGLSWDVGGSVVVGNGNVSVENARVYYSAAPFTSDHSLEFSTTFTVGQFQNVGWVADPDFSAPWAIFTTFETTTSLYARTSDGTNTLIVGDFIGSPHRYRIDWSATAVTFYVDGGQVAQHNVAIPDSMIPIASDGVVDGQAAQVDWMRISPYTSPCTFISRVLDAGTPVPWVSLSWVSSGTGIALSYRTGNTSTPDGTWTTYTAAPNSPTALNGTSRYIQYRAVLSTLDLTITPILESVTFTSAPPNYAPVITEGASISKSMSEDGVPDPFSLTLNATDPNAGDTLTWSILTQANNGTANASGTGLSKVIGYSPTANTFGPDSFVVQVSDDHGGTDNITVNVTITAVNDAPVISGQATLSTAEDTALAITFADLTVTDPDNDYPDDFTLTVQTGANYTLVDNTLTPALNFTGDLTVPVIVNDGTADSNTFNLTITVTPVNDAPVITEGASTNVTMSVNGLPNAFSLTLNATDVNTSDILTWSISTPASHGTAGASGTGSSKAINYTPTTDYAGADSFVVQVADGNGGTDTITVNVTIAAVTYTVTGNAGQPGVTITFTGGSTTTDASGNFSIIVPYGWSGTVTPSLAGYTFTPASRELANVTSDQSGVDFTATPIVPQLYFFLPLIMQNQ